MVGDPTGRTDMRKMMTREEIKHMPIALKSSFPNSLNLEKESHNGDNADWLLDLNYIEFLRDIGVHFSVNEC